MVGRQRWPGQLFILLKIFLDSLDQILLFHRFPFQAEVQTPEMIRLLTTVVAESVIDGIGEYFHCDNTWSVCFEIFYLIICTGGPTNQCQLNEEKLNLRSAVIFYSDNIKVTLSLHCPIERVVGTSKFQITKPDALFVVFLGIKWAYDFLKKNRS